MNRGFPILAIVWYKHSLKHDSWLWQGTPLLYSQGFLQWACAHPFMDYRANDVWQNGSDNLLRLRQLLIKLRMAVLAVTLESGQTHSMNSITTCHIVRSTSHASS